MSIPPPPPDVSLPSPLSAPEPADSSRRTVWILIGVIAVLVVVLVVAGLVWLLASGDDQDPGTTPTETAGTATPDVGPSPTPTETTPAEPTEEELLADAEQLVYDYYAAGDAQDCDALLGFMIGVPDAEEWLQECDFTYNRPGLTYSVEIEQIEVSLTSQTGARADVIVRSWGTNEGVDYCTRSDGWVELWQSRDAGWRVSGGGIDAETELSASECS